MTFSLPILYSFRRCPYAMRARLALYTAKIAHEHREVDLKQKPIEMLTLSPKGTVPVLQLVDGKVLEQSLDIMKWSLKDPALSPDESALIEENDTTFKKALDRYKYPGRYEEEKDINYRDIAAGFLKKLEDKLMPSTGPLTFLEMALFPFVRQTSQVDLAWFETQDYPHLKDWLDSIISKPLFHDIMQEFSPWAAGDEPNFLNFEK